MYYFYTQAEKERDEQRPEYDIYGDPYEAPRHLFIGAIAAYIGLIYDSVYMTRKYNIKFSDADLDYAIIDVANLCNTTMSDDNVLYSGCRYFIS